MTDNVSIQITRVAQLSKHVPKELVKPREGDKIAKQDVKSSMPNIGSCLSLGTFGLRPYNSGLHL